MKVLLLLFCIFHTSIAPQFRRLTSVSKKKILTTFNGFVSGIKLEAARSGAEKSEFSIHYENILYKGIKFQAEVMFNPLEQEISIIIREKGDQFILADIHLRCRAKHALIRAVRKSKTSPQIHGRTMMEMINNLFEQCGMITAELSDKSWIKAIGCGELDQYLMKFIVLRAFRNEKQGYYVEFGYNGVMGFEEQIERSMAAINSYKITDEIYQELVRVSGKEKLHRSETLGELMAFLWDDETSRDRCTFTKIYIFFAKTGLFTELSELAYGQVSLKHFTENMRKSGNLFEPT